MITFEIKDMTCGHCVSSITAAVRSVDPGAQLAFDLAAHRVEIEPTNTDTDTDTDMQSLQAAIAEAGYTPVPAPGQQAAALTAAAPLRRAGCCCGGASGCRS